MGRTAQLKKTSEQRCREAFVKLFSLPAEESIVTPAGAFWKGWEECWRYLEAHLLEEIQS